MVPVTKDSVPCPRRYVTPRGKAKKRKRRITSRPKPTRGGAAYVQLVNRQSLAKIPCFEIKENRVKWPYFVRRFRTATIRSAASARCASVRRPERAGSRPERYG